LTGFSQRIRNQREHFSLFCCLNCTLRKLERGGIVGLLAMSSSEPAECVSHVNLSSRGRVERQSFMKALQRERVISLGQVNCADTDQNVRAIEMFLALLEHLATLLISLERWIVLSLHETRVADQAQHARHPDLIAVSLKSREALVEILDCLSVVSLQCTHETDAA